MISFIAIAWQLVNNYFCELFFGKTYKTYFLCIERTRAGNSALLI